MITPEQVNYDGELPYGGGAPGLNRQNTVSVASFEPNGFGLHQMHGNVFERCQDVYDEGFYASPEASRKDPVCTSGSVDRVSRGGSWGHDGRRCRSADRYRFGPGVRFRYLGFRPAFFRFP